VYLIGLTGNIGSGKSTVLGFLAELGAEIIDADRLVHDLLARDPAVIRAVIDAFGSQVADLSSRIDRARLGQLVFADPAALRRLEAIVHPAVGAEIDRRLAATTAPVVVVEAIKLVEAGMHRRADALWVVTCPSEVAIRRLVEGRGMDEAEARRRLATQAPVEPKLAIADVIIDNGGTLEATRRQVEAAWTRIPRDNRSHLIQAVFFDAWGTLLTVRQNRVERFMEIAAALNLPVRRDDVATAIAQTEAELRAEDRPRIETLEAEQALFYDLYSRLLHRLGIDDRGNGLVERIVTEYPYLRWCVVYPDVPGVLDALKKRRIPMGVISNAYPSLLEVLNSLDLARYLEPVVVSALVGVEKPDPRIFRTALDRVGRPAEQTLFVDDVEANVIAAETLGMVGMLIDRDDAAPGAQVRRIRHLDAVLSVFD
jgi:dephospho-CoA kinase